MSLAARCGILITVTDSIVSPARAALVEHLRAHSVRTEGTFTLRSGETSSWYIDARQTTFDGLGAALVGRAVLEVLDDRVTAVGGMTIGADPIALATALVAGQDARHLAAFSIRKTAKDHGTGGRLVGPVGPGRRVAIIEDTTTTGGALLESIDVAISERLEVVEVVSLVDRSEGRVGGLLAERSIPYHVLVTPKSLGLA